MLKFKQGVIDSEPQKDSDTFDTSVFRFEDLIKEPLSGPNSKWGKVVTKKQIFKNGTDGWEIDVH